MSSSRRPWYPWYPKDFIVDEKVQGLSPLAELLYRRALDVMWQANDCQLPNHLLKLMHQFGKGLLEQEFKNAWSEIQHPGFELFKITDDEQWIYSKRLKSEAEKIENLCKIRRKAAKKGGKASAQAKGQPNAKQKVNVCSTHTDPDTDPYPDTDTENTSEYPNGYLSSKDDENLKNCPHDKIISEYHRILPSLPHIQVWDETSKKQLRQRWRQKKDHQCLEFWSTYFEWVSRSAFLMGNKTDFQADLHWLVKPTNFAKVINGRYHNNQNFHDRLKKVGDQWLQEQNEKDS